MPSSTTPIPIPISPGPLPQTQAYHNNLLSHISFGVRSYSASKTFYTAVLAPLGLDLVFDSESDPRTTYFKKNHIRTLGYGPDKDNELINIFELGEGVATPPEPGFHLALNAPTRLAVVEFHAAAVQNGGLDNGLPGVREQYGENYFAAFVVDPDGHRLEVVCKTRIADSDGEEEGKLKGEEREGEGGQ
ncbi:Glyoxalase/Bleomycin resistance protein/Dihydroxybiphenyl dioxygenase [Pseudoneurospora amorphoporcata]|uniref:Glyoxalase/Bleomycin resistance protein/Dihydroxybiphenyl dioxygenase n=1 Tax=Pseudoneurospora amorphoporcata TaxID=241081 RepID=A0AAN6SGZ6_9PEZI|nr:Glyoxalase/Bleomycin resistance protein/Dihydroxybiphenyl dioxygenase [Pseudoneurospora amorphoporcata]